MAGSGSVLRTYLCRDTGLTDGRATRHVRHAQAFSTLHGKYRAKSFRFKDEQAPLSSQFLAPLSFATSGSASASSNGEKNQQAENEPYPPGQVSDGEDEQSHSIGIAFRRHRPALRSTQERGNGKGPGPFAGLGALYHSAGISIRLIK